MTMKLSLDLELFFQNKLTGMIRRNWEKEKWRRLGEKSVLKASHVVCRGTFLSTANNVRNKKSRKIKQDPPRLLSRQPANHTLIQHRSNIGAYMFGNRCKSVHKQMKHLFKSLSTYT